MKLKRIGDRWGRKVPCVIDESGGLRDASTIIEDFGPETLSAKLLDMLKGVDLETLPVFDVQDQRVAPPTAQPRNIWCIGLNYSDHAKEAGMPIPDEPILFTKSSTAYCGAYDNILYSDKMTKLDWEVELGIVIGEPALNIGVNEALEHVFGLVLVNDVSERAWQMDRGGQWVKGKSFPNFCPVGPHLATLDEFDDIQTLDMWLDVNGQRRQQGNTDTMIFDVKTIVSYMSEFCQLEPGDLICTGTPPGVGAGMKPPQYLSIGDKVSLGIDGLGTQEQTVVALEENWP